MCNFEVLRNGPKFLCIQMLFHGLFIYLFSLHYCWRLSYTTATLKLFYLFFDIHLHEIVFSYLINVAQTIRNTHTMSAEEKYMFRFNQTGGGRQTMTMWQKQKQFFPQILRFGQRNYRIEIAFKFFKIIFVHTNTISLHKWNQQNKFRAKKNLRQGQDSNMRG